MKRFLLTAMIAGLLAPAGLYAQEVYKDGNRVVLDLTVEAGMPADAITSDSKTDRYVSAVPENNGDDQIDDNHIQTGTLTKKVYRKLEIAPKDLNASGAIGVGVSGKFKWAESFNFCRDLDYNGREWRLPIQRELMLMYIFSPALNAIFDATGGTRFSEGDYWSATEGTHWQAWYVSFPGGITSFLHSKSTAGYVRCVREL